MYRILRDKTTKTAIPGYMQSGGYEHPNPEIDDETYREANLKTIMDLAISNGLDPDTVEAVFVTPAEWAVIKAAQEAAELDAQPYDQKRRREYPSIYDYIDGVVKGDDAQVKTYIDACKAVKKRYPKDK